MKKMALIGGGSVRTYYFVESLMKFYKEMDIGELCIMDSDAEKLAYFGGIAGYLIQKEKSGLNVTLTDNPAEAVRGAEYIVTTVRVGQDEARAKDERIALNLGLIGQETTGAGGFSYAVRTIPVMLSYMELVEKYAAPNAIVFNFTNPSGLVTQALYDGGYGNIIGICDNATGIKIDMAEALQVNACELMVKVYGLNHLSWANRVELLGENILPALLSHDGFVESFHQFQYFDRKLVRHLGEIPNGYLYYYYHKERALQNLLAAKESRGEFICRNNHEMMEALRAHDIEKEPEACLRIYRDFMQRREGSYMQLELGEKQEAAAPVKPSELGIPALVGKAPATEVYEGYAGVVFNYIDSMQYGRNIDLAVSVPNRGAILDMEEDDVVEVTCTIGKDGAVPMSFSREEIAPSNLLLMKTVKRYEKLTVEAVRKKSKEAAVEALTIHPLVADYGLAVKLVEAYCAHNLPWIGEWK